MNGSASILAALLLLAPAAGAFAAPRPQRIARARRAQSELFYQAGVTQYAYGRFPQALASFQEALRRDPNDRAARIALTRVRAEIRMTAKERRPSAAPAPAARPSPALESGDSPLPVFARCLFFERTLGDERDREGRLQAVRGRIAQLLSERRLARARGRAFSKDAELHALSRRL
ncbi:MAG TPA: tetratricopeptide repeat protein [Elusimicrobiota bacterium]|jgi:tetratricopeptide (TPR) repeat protein|nr:tetratricopeptide repeat protein [Elusimicrobiota bacterium]